MYIMAVFVLLYLRNILIVLVLIFCRPTVRDVMAVLDPKGLERRRAHRLKRRVYTAKGPNYVIHVDGYDKIKPYGFSIHGAIDG